MCEVLAAPEYVRACACTAHEGVTKGHRVEAPDKSPKKCEKSHHGTKHGTPPKAQPVGFEPTRPKT
eukprot:430173-Pelagomonas_calceolata.AAC.1